MRLSPGLVTVIFSIFGRACGESVIQKQGHVTVSEGAFVTINCTYTTTTYPTLFWYVQYHGECPQLLIKVTKANEMGSHKGFEAMYDKEATSFHLKKAKVLVSDSAVHYCALSDTVAETTWGS